MKQKTGLYLFIIMTVVIGCSSDKQSSDSLPFIDVTKDYPEKEFVLTDIADVTYLHLDTENIDFTYKSFFVGSINSFTKSTIVVHDTYSGSVLFFSRDGIPKSRFNRKGQGAEEYNVFANILLYDETMDEVYIFSMHSDFIQVYSSSGEHRRKLILPQSVNLSQMIFFDEQSLLVYDDKSFLNMTKKFTGEEHTFKNDSTFILISKTDGEILDYIEMASGTIDVAETYMINRITSERISASRTVERMIKCTGGLLLCNPENDTIFFFGKDKLLTPVMHKTPLISNSKIVLENYIDFGQYQLLSIFQINHNDKKYTYIREKKTGEIYRPKVITPDYKEKEFLFDINNKRFHENEYYFELDLIELKQAYRENKLGGKLKELVATLDEDEDNNVFMFVKFRSDDF